MDAKLERERLKDLIDGKAPSFRISRVQTVEGARVELLGGRLPAYFDKGTRRLIVWGRGNRWSGAEVDLETLLAVERACIEWYVTLS